MSRHWTRSYGKPDYLVRAVERICDIFDTLQREPDGVTVPTVVKRTGISRSTLLHYLTTLEARRYVEHDQPGGVYRLGHAFLPAKAQHIDVLLQRARRHLEEIREQLGETVSLGLLDGNRILRLDVAESEEPLRVTRTVGASEPLHASALGKAIAAELGDDRVTDLLTAEGMPRFTERTITDPETYVAHLAQVRGRGYALDDAEHEPDVGSVAVAVPGDRFLVGLSVCVPADRLSPYRAENIADVLEQHARALSR